MKDTGCAKDSPGDQTENFVTFSILHTFPDLDLSLLKEDMHV